MNAILFLFAEMTLLHAEIQSYPHIMQAKVYKIDEPPCRKR